MNSHSNNAVNMLASAVGAANVIFGEKDVLPFVTEWRDKFVGEALCVVKPANTQEVAECVKIARDHGLKIVPQGGNTGLVGGQIAFDASQTIVLNLSRLNSLREVDPAGNTMTVEAGMILQHVQEHADKADRFFPLSLGAEGSCQIGGNISSNAGGTGVLAYGNTRELVMGLEVVLPNGEIWNGLNKLRKDNTGYDMKNLFIGAEGTLGIVTAATLKLFPKPKGQQVAFSGFETLNQAASFFTLAKSIAGQDLTAFEIMPRIGIEFTSAHVEGARDPMAEPHNWYALIEVSSNRSEEDAASLFEMVLEQAFENGFIADAAVANSLSQRKDFWHMRHEMSGAQKPEGGSIKHDVSVPVDALPAFMEEALKAVQETVPGCRPVPFGHWGDGNIHFNISQPIGADKQAFLARWDEVNEVVHSIVVKYGGSISAEHGIGLLKRDLLGKVKNPVTLSMMYQIKQALDPQNMMNPGKVLPPRD